MFSNTKIMSVYPACKSYDVNRATFIWSSMYHNIICPITIYVVRLAFVHILQIFEA